MKLLVDGLEPGSIDVSVVLRGGDVSVAQEFLNDAQIGAAFEQVSGEAVPEGVG